MKGSKPSRTAHFVALARAMANAGLSHVAGFSDPTAAAFLNDKGKKSLGQAVAAIQSGNRSVRMEMARTMADMMALRTSAIDVAVKEAVASGVKQLVILGAGYDGRAWRLPELHDVDVYEVDYAATQQSKRSLVTSLPEPIGNVHFVTIDFERESLHAVLEGAGHVATKPTCWIWEGVVMYLTHQAMDSTLSDIGRRRAAGSSLIINYHTAHRRLLMRLIFKLIGEPQISAYTPEEMEARLRRVGFRVSRDTSMQDWNQEFASGRANVERGAYMHIVVAQADGR